MESFKLLAEPWWVNILFLFPLAVYYFWRKGISLTKNTLAVAAIFGIAFGFVETAVVIYLRAAIGLLPGYNGTLADVMRLASPMFQQAQVLNQLPKSLFTIEILREAATMIMLVGIALLAAKTLKERCAVFIWTFAVWDIFYYVGLWATVRWPSSLTTPDALFLIPIPWYSQVWFPILVSGLVILAVTLRVKKID